MKKRLLSIALAFVMTTVPVSTTVFAELGGETTKSLSPVFTDMPNDWSTTALENAVTNGLLFGDNGEIMPSKSVTRSQMAAILGRAFAATDVANIESFTDVKADDWFYADMQKAVAMGTFYGSGNQLNPESNITREDAFSTLARALHLSDQNASLAAFSDSSEVADYAKAPIAALVKGGYIAGSDGKLNPKATITRAELAKIMDNAVKLYIKDVEVSPKEITGNVMISKANTVLKDVTVNGDVIIADGIGNGDVALNNVTVTGRLLVRGGGINSIKVEGNSSIKNVVMAKPQGEVRLAIAPEATVINVTIAKTNSAVSLEGKMETLIVGSSAKTTLSKATVAIMKVTQKNADIAISKDTVITKLEVSEVSRIQNNGTITTAIVSADNVVIGGNRPIETKVTDNVTVKPKDETGKDIPVVVDPINPPVDPNPPISEIIVSNIVLHTTTGDITQNNVGGSVVFDFRSVTENTIFEGLTIETSGGNSTFSVDAYSINTNKKHEINALLAAVGIPAYDGSVTLDRIREMGTSFTIAGVVDGKKLSVVFNVGTVGYYQISNVGNVFTVILNETAKDVKIADVVRGRDPLALIISKMPEMATNVKVAKGGVEYVIKDISFKEMTLATLQADLAKININIETLGEFTGASVSFIYNTNNIIITLK